MKSLFYKRKLKECGLLSPGGQAASIPWDEGGLLSVCSSRAAEVKSQSKLKAEGIN